MAPSIENDLRGFNKDTIYKGLGKMEIIQDTAVL